MAMLPKKTQRRSGLQATLRGVSDTHLGPLLEDESAGEELIGKNQPQFLDFLRIQWTFMEY